VGSHAMVAPNHAPVRPVWHVFPARRASAAASVGVGGG
jgi:hypothetical protein